MRTAATVTCLSIASCICFFVACSSDDPAARDETDAGRGGSSGTSGNQSSGRDAGETDPDADVPVVVGDGSIGAGCNQDDECNSKVCSIGHACVVAPSCRASKNKAAPGIDTCGAAEPGDESCCTTLTLPTTTSRTLDKFEITSGRVRAFIDSLPEKNLQKWAKDFAAANPDSELGKLETEYPGYLDTLPSAGEGELTLWLGAFPVDAMGKYDGCFTAPGSYGHATYWQEPQALKGYGIGVEGQRAYPASMLDTKSVNCMAPVLLATFCAWDGGELARPSDYWEIWSHTPETLPVNEFGQSGGIHTKVWDTILRPGEFNFRNGRGVGCTLPGWPGCDPNTTEEAPPAIFFSFPSGGNPADDDTPQIGAPGRFPKDVTAVKSPDGSGWMDVGGNMLEAAWPKVNGAFKTTTQNFCATANPGGGGGACNRDQPAIPSTGEGPEARPGSLYFAGQPPTVSLIGASFEGHIGYGENYFANATDDETKLQGYGFPAHFQYGKVGGRCARTK